MLVLIFSIIIAIIVIIKAYDGLWPDGFFEWFLVIFIGAFIGFIFFIVSGVILIFSLPKVIEYENIPIVSLQDSIGVSGHFFIGSGYIGDKPYYSYYVKENDGFKLNNVNAENILIKYGETPYVKVPKSCHSDFDWIFPCAYGSSPIEIQVPNGSIKENYSLDAK